MDIKALLLLFLFLAIGLAFAPTIISLFYTGDCYATQQKFYNNITTSATAWEGFNVTGAGNATVNGVYCNYNLSKINGCYSYNMSVYKLTYNSTGKTWVLNSTTISMYYNRSSANCTVYLTAWGNNTNYGADPAPTLAGLKCSGFLYYDYNVTLLNVTYCPAQEAGLGTKTVLALVPLLFGIFIVVIIGIRVKHELETK